MSLSPESRIKTFFLFPLRSIRDGLNADPETQWFTVSMAGIIIGLVALVCFGSVEIIKSYVRPHYSEISSGIVVWKYVTESKRILVGKIFVTQPARCHVVIRGKDKSGKSIERDVTVAPEDFENMEEGSAQSFK